MTGHYRGHGPMGDGLCYFGRVYPEDCEACQRVLASRDAHRVRDVGMGLLWGCWFWSPEREIILTARACTRCKTNWDLYKGIE